MPPYRLAALLALFQIVVIGVMLGPPRFSNSVTVPRGIGSPVLAMEVALNPEEIDLLLGPKPSADRITMRLKTIEDFGFIAGYGSLFVVLSLILRRRERLLGNLAMVVSLGAMVFDVVENIQILRICDTALPATTQSMIDLMRHASYAKWTCAFLAIGILTRVYFQDGRPLARVLGWLYAAVAVVGLAGVVTHPVLFNYAMLPLPLGLAGTAWLFWWKSGAID